MKSSPPLSLSPQPVPPEHPLPPPPIQQEQEQEQEQRNEEKEEGMGQSRWEEEAGLRPDGQHRSSALEGLYFDYDDSEGGDQDDGSATGQRCYRDGDVNKDQPVDARGSGHEGAPPSETANQTLTEKLDKEIEAEKQVCRCTILYSTFSFIPCDLCPSLPPDASFS